MAAKYSELVIDGVLGDIYDKTAIHKNQIQEELASQLLESNIKNVLLDLLFPVGSIKVGGSNPGTYLGGVWTLRPDLMIVGAGNLYPEGSQGGSPDAVVVEHNHIGSGSTDSAGAHTHTISGIAASAGAHSHRMDYLWSDGSGKGSAYMMSNKRKVKYRWTESAGDHTHPVSGSAASAGAHTHPVSVSVANAGVSGAGKNMPPYRAYNIWERTA